MKTREWNPSSLCFDVTRMEDGECNTRSVLGCGSTLPLFPPTDWVRPAESARGLAQSKTCRIVLAFCFLLSAVSFQASGQSYSIDWYTIDGGGGTSTGGVYSVSGTIGQPDASGAMTGGNYSLTGGFWALISVVQTPGAPTLYISYSGNMVTVYWQAVAGWSLQQNSNLAATAGWSASSGVTTLNSTNYLNLTSPPGNLFFRLSNQ